METARLTDERGNWESMQSWNWIGKLRIIADRLEELPRISVTYFIPDDKKKAVNMLRPAGK